MNSILRIALLAVSTIIVTRIIASRKAREFNPPPIEQIDSFMAYNAEEAVSIAKNKRISLDYSEASIAEVDKLLEEIHQEYLRTKSKDGLWGLAFAFGAYVGEIVRRGDPNYFWKKDHPVAGENSFSLISRVGTNSVFPLAWCHKRMLNGGDDNIVIKLKVFRSVEKKGIDGLSKEGRY